MDEALFPLPEDAPAGPLEVAPGAVHLPGWLDAAARAELLAACRQWARPPAGLRTVRMPNGGRMSVRQVSLGWHWYPYRYVRTVEDGDGAPVKPLPGWLAGWARAAVARAYTVVYGDAGAFGAVRDGDDLDYDVALVNFYGPQARMGMHQDLEERADVPVVSFSLGDACVFRLGNATSRNRPWRDVVLRDGDAFVFGGPSRRVYHGVPKVHAGSAEGGRGPRAGRLNVTVRCTGLAAAR